MPKRLHKPIKLYLNEHLSPRLANQIRQYGFDAVSSQEAEMLSETDEAQLDWAAKEQRAILTFNVVDFMVLHQK